MTAADILTILKIDLQISSSALDDYLSGLIDAARAFIIREGITLADTPEDAQLIEMYAAYLYRSRRDTSLQMPRMLRWSLNNRLFGAKARETVDG